MGLNQPVDDFAEAVAGLGDLTWASGLIQRMYAQLDRIFDFQEVVLEFRAHRTTMSNWTLPHSTQLSAFSVEGPTDGPTLQGRGRGRGRGQGRGRGSGRAIQGSDRTYGNCICGDDHKFVDCPYANPSLRPPNWQLKREVELELTAKLKNPKLKSAWERAKKETSSRKEPKMDASRFVEVDLEGEDIAYSVASHMVSSVAKTSTLRNSVLLDSAATVHVFNDLSQFTDF